MGQAWTQRLSFGPYNYGVLGGGAAIRTSGNMITAGNTASGIVPTNTTTPTGLLNDFRSFTGTDGFITGAELICSVNGFQQSVLLCDRLWTAGAYAGNSGLTTLSGQPSFAGRLPGGSYVGTQLYVERFALNSGANTTLTITYTNQDGVAGRTISAYVAVLGYSLPACYQIPLAAGDSGIRKVESVTASGSSDTFNLLIARPLFNLPCAQSVNTGSGVGTVRFGMEQLGMPRIYPTSCFWHSVFRVPGAPAVIDLSFDVTCEAT